jgi:transcriptional regulator with PAS, ATPase and Fis domain
MSEEDGPESDREEPTRPDVSSGRTLATRVLAFWEGGTTTRILAPDTSLVIGRQAECDIRIDLASVSRRHAQITGNSPATVRDLGGMNGVRVRGEKIPVDVDVPVFEGDAIELGGAIVLLQGPRDPRPPQDVPRFRDEEPMQLAQRLLALVAPNDISVLLLGETGVGKTLAAKELHARSTRARGPFLRINCAALPEALLEAELFGYERGAFTGATQSKPGLFETAEKGTVLLDEVGEMSPVTQAKLLTVLETREVVRLGSVKPRPIDVRFIAATNRDLLARAQEGAFRADLYYRLNGISILIPPLRERQSEIEALARKFLHDACVRSLRQPVELTGEALAVLLRYPFPGNLRELRNTMDRAAVLSAGGPVYAEHLLFEPARALVVNTPSNAFTPVSLASLESREPPPLPPPPPPAPDAAAGLKSQMDAFERDRIVAALAQCNGNQTRAAEVLGISRRTLVMRIEQYRLPRPRKR